MTTIAFVDCGHCGKPSRPARKTNLFCSVSCSSKARHPRPGPTNSNWRGGKTSHPLYDTYLDMIARCARPSHHAYQRYGGRGIRVCERWRSDFWAFVTDMGERPPGMSIDRVDNDRGYEPGNCRWATTAEQNRNRRPRELRHACAQGHAYTPENTRVTPAGKRQCRTCVREYARQARLRRKTPSGD